MWPTALAFFEQAAASPASVIDGSPELIVEDVQEEKLGARARRAALDMTRIRELAAERPSSAWCLPPSLRWLARRATTLLSSCPVASALRGRSPLN
eukprot:5950523-Pleurochrysis_carterae.AAC.1